jgi:D-tagatose-1,6-bisphosphate aldolase subunit GatZ/KbaZ
VEDAKKELYANLIKNKIPLSLLSQFMPEEFYRVCAGSIPISLQDLVYSHIRRVAGIYARACGLASNEER